MVGTDGVPIPGDTRWMNTLNWANLGSWPRATFHSSTMVANDARRIAISCARNIGTTHPRGLQLRPEIVYEFVNRLQLFDARLGQVWGFHGEFR